MNVSAAALRSQSPNQLSPVIQPSFEQRIVHSYNLRLKSHCDVQFIITIETPPSRPTEKCLTLNCKAGGIERSLCNPVFATLRVDPRDITFNVFLFPKPSQPPDCLFAVRVWLRSYGVDHRIFADDNFWIGKDPGFHLLENVSLAYPRFVTLREQVYRGTVGTSIDFVVKMTPVSNDGVWSVSVHVDGGGFMRELFEGTKLRFHCRLEDISFHIYTVPMESSPKNSMHRVRVWIRSEGVCQRLWKSDDFRIGGGLDFASLADHAILAVRDSRSPTVGLHTSLLPIEPKPPARPSSSMHSLTNVEDFPPAYNMLGVGI